MQTIRPLSVIVLSTLFLFTGCSSTSYLPSVKEEVVVPWDSYDKVKADFDRIVPGVTRVAELKEFGFSPEATSNIQILNYLDIMQRFMPNQSITVADLDEAIQQCLAVEEHCSAYEVQIRRVFSERYGNVFFDLFSFRRKTKLTGWEFKGIIVFQDDLVVYKLAGGKPHIDEFRDSKNPLGPLQSPGGAIWEIAK